MLSSMFEFKNSVVRRFGPILGYAILVVGGLAVLSVLWFLFKSLIKLAIALAIGAILVFGAIRLYEIICSKKTG
ncbi:MAG TPA: hypothetical protein PK369_00480 [Thermoclostridium sp.]|nr:hypothetical protein [Clostridiaceae bacterium]HOQ75025.1 hypothetical protein [Thermoclostridium sp.]HPU44786.1 hypothetical protein [Thermoclostridium sp.]